MTNLSAVAFGFTAVAYLLSAAAHFGFFFLRRWESQARWITWLAWGLHSVTLLLRVLQSGRPPLFSLYDATLFFSWLVVMNYLIVDLTLKVRVIGTFLIPLVFIFLMYALSQPKTVANNPELQHLVVTVHVIMAFLSYGSFALAFIAGILYIIQERQLRTKSFSLLYQRLPSLESLDRMGNQFIVFGYPLLTLAILAGSFWAHTAWGQYWTWEPKETWSLVTWLIYTAYLGLRFGGRWRGRRAAWVAVVGFSAVLVNFFVVSAFLSQLHSF